MNICTNIVGFYNTDLNVSDEAYYYDDLGTNVTLKSKSDVNYVANIFTKQNANAEKIDKITFASNNEGINYTVYYASNASLKDYVEIAKGTTSHAGYISIIPSKDIYVTEKFSIIVKYETDSNTEDIIPIAMKGASTNSPYHNFEITKGVSYFSTNGEKWLDLGEKVFAQASIRVYTSIKEQEQTPEINNTEKVENDANVEVVNPNKDVDGVVLGDTVSTPDDSDIEVDTPPTGMVSGISIIVVLLIIGTVIYFKKKNKIFKI